MIRIDDDYFVEVDEFNYTLKKDLHRKLKNKDGEDTDKDAVKTIGYFSTLDKALERFAEETLKGKLREGDMWLAEACSAVREHRATVNELLEEVRSANKGE